MNPTRAWTLTSLIHVTDGICDMCKDPHNVWKFDFINNKTKETYQTLRCSEHTKNVITPPTIQEDVPQYTLQDTMQELLARAQRV